MIVTSTMSGTLVSRVRPTASSAAAISLSALFFAPTTGTSPRRLAPPTTRNLSTSPREPIVPGPHLRLQPWSTSPGSTPAPATTARRPSATSAGRARTTRGSPRTPTPTRPTPRSAWRSLRRAAARTSPPCCAGPERPVRRRRGPVHPARRVLRVPAAAGPATSGRRARGRLRPVQRRAGDAALVHPARRHPGRGATCTWPARSPGGPSAPPGRRSSGYGDQPGADDGPGGVNPLTATYLNRLSDLLFILARVANLELGGDVLWQPGGGREQQPGGRAGRVTERRAGA